MDILRLIIAILNVWEILIIVRAVLSWFNPNPYNQAFRFLSRITDPFLSIFRSLIPLNGIDFSPMIAIFLIEIVKSLLLRI